MKAQIDLKHFQFIFLSERETAKLSLRQKLFVCRHFCFRGNQKLNCIAHFLIPEK